MSHYIHVKSEKEFIRDYGNAWKSKKFPVHDMSPSSHVQVHPKMVGLTLQLEEHEYEYYKDYGVLRWSDKSFTGIAYLTKEMIVGTGKYKERSVIVNDIYKAKHELIKVKTSSSYTIKEEIIKARMKLVKIEIRS